MLTPSTPFVSASTPAQRYAPRPYLADTTPNPHLSGPAGKLVPSKFRPLVKYLENSRLKGEWPVEKGALVRVFWNRADRNQVGTEKLKHYLNAAAVADIIDLGLHGKPSKQPIIGLKKRWHGVRL
ncbi:hypothetical protein NEOLEDRAFT_1129583 [Neolentinus lepideus HHB14362 ss-1]|uniref:Uncharacterized protein n=1 Tax=Neolentinus lepideus HHB14362 ss-1 TaxID=1314782 RepID=A0A165UIT8_9AGAM|nr:hypothetical protein NEOLEDRAFT_1129583 [Neolentinus lepideus HHB14362 ss-1]